MKSYLSLISVSAKVRKHQNRMTILCIIISVFLVTTIFSISDMMIRMENAGLQDKHGNWHIRIENISPDIADEIRQRPDVIAAGWAEAFNSDADLPYYINEKKVTLYGADAIYMTQIVNAAEEGDIPQNDDEIMLSSNAKLALDVQIGDSVTLYSPQGTASFTVSGFGSDDKEYYEGQTYLVAAYLTRAAFTEFMEQNEISCNPSCYIRFQNASKASDAIGEIMENYALSGECITENTAVMGMAGKSRNKSVQIIYSLAVMLFVLVLIAGVLMISGSMNSSVAQRTKFFGMMRCIGASRRQIIRFVRLEALNWCKTAVPAGLVFGIATSCGVCALMRYGIGGEWAYLPVFALSPIGIISGSTVGIVTVLIAAGAPARHAARVSPVAAVSGNLETALSAKHKTNINLGKIEMTLGAHHATASRKNWFLMTASFSLSIILFLCFSVGLEFAKELLPVLRSWQPDITLGGYANERVLSQELSDTVRSIKGVDYVFSCTSKDVSAESSRQGIYHVNLISYSDSLLDSTGESLIQGELEDIYGESYKAVTVLNKDNPLRAGDIVYIEGKEVEITCVISSGLYPAEYSVICSHETFERLTGEQNDDLIGVQLGSDATAETIREINALAGSNVIFTDMRKRNQEDLKTYLAIAFVMYCFLAIVAIITLFNIINSISMSVTSRIKQYGVMRAVGMDSGQLTRMIIAEAFTYAFSGLVVGCVAGIALSRFLYARLLTHYCGKTWGFPTALLGVIILFNLASVTAASYAPAKQIRNMSITDTINQV